MIDKCEIQKAAEEINRQIILCEIHIIKLMKQMLNKYVKNDNLQNELNILLLKDIARSKTIIERAINVSGFKIFCSQHNQFEFSS